MVSIHAPARGATTAWAGDFQPRSSFNPRPRTGGDMRPSRRSFRPRVSIHAPARGATRTSLGLLSPHDQFQSTPPHGGRPVRGPERGGGLMFQSTPPHGGRLVFAGSVGERRPFQSTPPHGGRHGPELPDPVLAAVSIHAPARGATCDRSSRGTAQKCFNPRPRTGGDRDDGFDVDGKIVVSIHAPARGATPSS